MSASLSELLESERVVVIVHRHADLDSVGAAVGLAATLDADVDVATPGSVAGSATQLLDGRSVVTDPDLAAYDLQVVVDAPSRERVAPVDPTVADTPLLLVDHHEPDDLHAHATHRSVDTEAPATAALVAALLRDHGFEIPPAGARALAAGILDDTDFRAVLMPDVGPLVRDLLAEAAAGDGTLESLFERDPPWSERAATAKAVVRADGYKAGQRLLLVTRVGGHERAAADALTGAGADIGVALSGRSDHTRVVASATDGTEISLPEDLLEPLAAAMGGDGGGHATAGVANVGSTDTEAVEAAVVERVERALGVQFGPMT